MSSAAAVTAVNVSSITFSWDANGNPRGSTRYKVQVSSDPNFTLDPGAVVTSSLTYNTFLSTAGLKANTTYFFQVIAINTYGSSTPIVSPGLPTLP